MNTAFWSATRLAQALRAKKLGAVEFFDLYAARVRQHDRALNAICVMDLDAGRKNARAADRAKGRKGPLHGVPMTVKESFNVAGWPTTWGQPEHRDNVAKTDALAGGKLPVGVQVVGPQYGDYRTIDVARLIEREYFAFTPPPGYD